MAVSQSQPARQLMTSAKDKDDFCDPHHIVTLEIGANICDRYLEENTMKQHLPAVRPARVLIWRQVKRGIVALRRCARSGTSVEREDVGLSDTALSRWEPMFKLPNRVSRSH